MELWEQWSDHEVKVLRVRLPFIAKKLELFIIARGQMESLLRRNLTANLDDFEKMDTIPNTL